MFQLWCECEYGVTVRTRRSSVIRCHDDDCYRATNLSCDQHFSILMLKDAAHRGYLFVFCAKYRVSQAPYSTKRIRDTLFFHIFSVKTNSEARSTTTRRNRTHVIATLNKSKYSIALVINIKLIESVLKFVLFRQVKKSTQGVKFGCLN